METFETCLEALLSPTDVGDDVVWRAARYSLLGGGKRVRPQLLLRAYATFKDAPTETVLRFAAALEMVHTYSLIHDDLPAMDDDDTRRGKPACHIAFGEATAILAGDLLLTRAFETLLEAYADDPNPGALRAMHTLARAAGGRGMILGQSLDLSMEASSADVPLDRVHRMASLKTACLIRAAVTMGAHLANAPDAAVRCMDRYGEAIGVAFQAQDDRLDVTSSKAELGKSIRKDERDDKKTFVTVAGMAATTDILDRLTADAFDALHALERAGHDPRPLSEYTQTLLERTM